MPGRWGFRWEKGGCCADFLSAFDVARWQEGAPRFGVVGALCFGIGGGCLWCFGIGRELAHRFVCRSRRGGGVLSLGKKVGYHAHSSEDPGKMEKNSRTRICSCLVLRWELPIWVLHM
jgi:hypothetical protein